MEKKGMSPVKKRRKARPDAPAAKLGPMLRVRGFVSSPRMIHTAHFSVYSFTGGPASATPVNWLMFDLGARSVFAKIVITFPVLRRSAGSSKQAAAAIWTDKVSVRHPC